MYPLTPTHTKVCKHKLTHPHQHKPKPIDHAISNRHKNMCAKFHGDWLINKEKMLHNVSVCARFT